MKKIYSVILGLGMLSLSHGQVSDLGSYVQVTDVSNNGVAVGNVFGVAIFMWSEANSGTIIGEAGDSGVSGNANISADGSVISTALPNPSNQNISEAVRYNVADESLQFLGYLGVVSDGDTSSPWGMSSNGQNIAGFAWTTSSKGEAVLWKNGQAISALGSTVSGRSSRANDVNADGSVVVGWQDASNGIRQGAIWRNGIQELLRDNDQNILGEAVSVSADGKIICGTTLGSGKGYIWNEDTGTVFFTSDNPDYITEMTMLSDDGKTALGFSFDPTQSILLGEGFIWTETGGQQKLDDYVATLGYDNLGINFSVPTGLSPDGKYLGGIGVNFDEGDAKGFVIKLPGATMGTAQPAVKNKMTVYPNPVRNTVTLQTTHKVFSAEVQSADGRVVHATDKITNKQLDLSHLTPGLYLLKVRTDRGFETVKIIKN